MMTHFFIQGSDQIVESTDAFDSVIEIGKKIETPHGDLPIVSLVRYRSAWHVMLGLSDVPPKVS